MAKRDAIEGAKADGVLNCDASRYQFSGDGVCSVIGLAVRDSDVFIDEKRTIGMTFDGARKSGDDVHDLRKYQML